jgi:DNA primase
MDAVEAIKQRLSIEDVVGDYVQLRRMGVNMKGLCPFHNEKTPSFTVSVDKGIYHCFGCSEGGDMFEFIMKVDGLDFKEALLKLANKAGVNLEDFGHKKSQNVTRLIDISDWAAKFYQVNLTINKDAIDYVVRNRKISKKAIEDFKIGYAPKNGLALWEFLKNKGVAEEDALMAGLIKKNNRGLYDVFRGRVTIALSDQSGRTIGFTARAIADQQPKYLNTSSTPIYDKGNNVFAWHLAKDSIRKNDLAVLVEGNMDVIASHAKDVKNVVATAGTALTSRQLKIISRITKNIALSFDSDSAGLAATIRAIPIAQPLDISLSVIDCKPYKDPDEMIQKDIGLWQRAIESRKPVFDWLVEHYRNMYDLKTGTGKKSFSDSIIPIIKEIRNSIEQDHYVGLIAELLDVSKDAVLRSFSTVDTFKSRPTKQSVYKVDKIEEDRQLENTILGLAKAFPRAYCRT